MVVTSAAITILLFLTYGTVLILQLVNFPVLNSVAMAASWHPANGLPRKENRHLYQASTKNKRSCGSCPLLSTASKMYSERSIANQWWYRTQKVVVNGSAIRCISETLCLCAEDLGLRDPVLQHKAGRRRQAQ